VNDAYRAGLCSVNDAIELDSVVLKNDASELDSVV
jgi:hypothetical protein